MLLLALLLAADSAATQMIPVAPAETLSVTVAGDGVPVVMVPGLFGSAYAFRNVAPPLTAAGYRTIIIEPLGIGRSARPPHADYSLTAQAQRLAAVLDSIRVNHAVLVAHSVGGAIVLRLAILRPDLVRAIVSIEGGPTESATTPSFRIAMKFAPILRVIGGRNVLRGQAIRHLRRSSGDPSWITEETILGYTADAARDLGATLDAFRGMADAREPWRLGNRLAEIGCPVHLLVGGADHTGGPTPTDLALMQGSLAALTVETVSRSGHFIFEERPEIVIATIRQTAEAVPTHLTPTVPRANAPAATSRACHRAGARVREVR